MFAHVRRASLVALGVSLPLFGLGIPGAQAVNQDHGNRVVSDNPSNITPHVMNGSVNSMTQVGNKIIAVGTFTRVSPADSFSNTGDDVTRNRIFAFDATTGAIDPNFNPDLNKPANSVDTDGTNIYVGGTFTSVGGDFSSKRLIKLTASGDVVSNFKVLPNKPVNEVVVRGSRVYAGGKFTNLKNGRTTFQRASFGAVNAGSGAVDPGVDVPFTGVYDPANGGGGTTAILRFDVSPDGSRLAAVGNFSTVGGQSRPQVAVVDTSGATAKVAPWATDRFSRARNNCAKVFDTFTRDVDFSPDGSYFVVTTTGAFAGGANSGTMCDSISRWKTNSTDNDPTWIDYTGGDTTYGVAVTGSAVYVGGHFRWHNNSFQGDQAGPGAVPRKGIAALDPVNGLPLSWNPGRARGVGAQALFATDQGLWVGSDTKRLGGEVHGRVAFLPLVGGTTVPSVPTASLPNDLFLGQSANAQDTGVLYRINAAGSVIQSSDSGPNWSNDSGFVSGGNTADWGSGVPVDGTVPAGTPSGIFATERYAPQDWNLPVVAGRDVTVRLYFANQYDGTAAVGQRVFDVLIDGTTRLDDFDIARAAGHKTGTMRPFTLTTDADGIDIDLRAVTENPLINGIEVIDNDFQGGAAAASGNLLRQRVDGSGAPVGASSVANSSIDWSTVRGAFLINGTVYYGLADGSFNKRTFNKSNGSLGVQKAVNLYDDPDNGQRIPFAIANLTGMSYDTDSHRIYYTVFGDSRLFYRYFTPESEVVGSSTFVANSNGVNFGAAAGLTLASGRLLYGSSVDGSLRSVSFAGGQVTGSPSVVSADGTWKYRSMMVPNN